MKSRTKSIFKDHSHQYKDGWKCCGTFIYVSFVFNCHWRIYLLIWDTEQGREGGREAGERERGTSISMCALTGDWTRNLHMCPDQGAKLKSFGVWEETLINAATQPGQKAVVNLHNGILCSCKKEGTLTYCNSTDGSGEYYAKWNKPGSKRKIPHDLIYVESNEQIKLTNIF